MNTTHPALVQVNAKPVYLCQQPVGYTMYNRPIATKQKHCTTCHKAMMQVDIVALGLMFQKQVLPCIQELPAACKLCA